MREWNLQSGDPLSLTLAADVRLGPTDYVNDHIWELILGGGDPPAVALQTTYGLRAKSLRMFPRFIEGDNITSDPATFAQPVSVNRIFPNFIALSFSPFPDLDVNAEYWVPESHGAAGRVKLTNQGKNERRITVEWVGQLTPTEGQRMAAVEMQAATVLAGSTSGLSPVIFLTGGPKPGPGTFSSLVLAFDLPPGGTRQFTWTHAALAEREASFHLARSLAASKWEAELSRLELLNAGHIDIYTGDAEWDAVFMLAQKSAISLFVGPTPHLPFPSFVLTRQPDQGFSLRGDGSDYNHLWNGQTPLEAYTLASLILPVAPKLAQGLLGNFLAAQNEDGSIDWKPGLGGQRGHLTATPLLANLAWHIYETVEETSFLADAFPSLLNFFRSWFTPQHDRDQDGAPEWDHSLQSGFEDHPVYSYWHDWAAGVDISTAESPALCTFLYRDCQALIRIATLLKQDEFLPELQATEEKLKEAIGAFWDDEQACYFDRDRDTHQHTASEWLGQRLGEGTILLNRTFEHPIRLLAHIKSRETTRPRPLLFVHGAGAAGKHRVERITPEQFRWGPGLGRLTGRYVYSAIDRIEIFGLKADDEIVLYTANYDCQDQSLLAPLWAGIPDPERGRRLVEESILNPGGFWQAFGIPACTRPPDLDQGRVCVAVNPAWNALIGEGLVKYGYREDAAELVKRLMSAVIQTLKRESAFRRYYQADSGQGIGERNAVNGLAPVSLFLEVLGVRLISSTRVALAGTNPFPWPVTVKFRGLTVLRHKDKTSIIFPDGQAVEIDDPRPRIVSLEMIKS